MIFLRTLGARGERSAVHEGAVVVDAPHYNLPRQSRFTNGVCMIEFDSRKIEPAGTRLTLGVRGR